MTPPKPARRCSPLGVPQEDAGLMGSCADMSSDKVSTSSDVRACNTLCRILLELRGIIKRAMSEFRLLEFVGVGGAIPTSQPLDAGACAKSRPKPRAEGVLGLLSCDGLGIAMG